MILRGPKNFNRTEWAHRKKRGKREKPFFVRIIPENELLESPSYGDRGSRMNILGTFRENKTWNPFFGRKMVLVNPNCSDHIQTNKQKYPWCVSKGRINSLLR